MLCENRPTRLRYTSNVQRADVVNLLKEFLIKAGHKEERISK